MFQVIRDYFRRRKLRKLLNDPRFEFRKLPTLAKAAGVGEQRAAELLETIGARPAYRNRELWGLKDKVGHRPRRRHR